MQPNQAVDEIRDEIRRRWQIVDWPRMCPWWPRPSTVKILFYADGSVQHDGGPFYGLKQVIATLTADPYSWVKFEIVTVHRSNDPSADHEGLDLAEALALDDFDELWIYSILSAPQLTAPELAAAETFMDDQDGGVLITGDHASFGAAFGNLPRAGKMRQLPAPLARPPDWNTTLRPGANAAYEFSDQSDQYPQPLELTWYRGGVFWKRPHPVLCSPQGPIDIFPDHQHEGEAVAPAASPASEWPGGQPAEVIAKGSIVDPSGTVGRKIGVLSAYDGHSVAVGRILADSTWHHHFDINLRGVPNDPTRNGFVTPGSDQWLSAATKIEHFFLNAAIWLAPPARQREMRFAAWWPVLWDAELLELGHRAPVIMLGGRAYDALGRYAPECIVFSWIWDLVEVELQKLFFEMIGEPDGPPPLFEYVAGVATRRLMSALGVSSDRSLPKEPPEMQEFERVLEGSVREAVEELLANRERTDKNLQEIYRRCKT